MLLKHRSPRIDSPRPIEVSPGFEHLNREALAILRWLKEHRVEFVLTGAVAAAVHTGSATEGPVAIVPAPYRRNLERLARALTAAQATLRGPGAMTDPATPAAVTVETLSGAEVRAFSCRSRQIDVVGTAAPAASGSSEGSSYQELLYEATRFELGPGLEVEVASPEDIEHYAHLRRTGTAPEIRVSRQSEVRQAGNGRVPTEAPDPGLLHDSG